MQFSGNDVQNNTQSITSRAWVGVAAASLVIATLAGCSSSSKLSSAGAPSAEASASTSAPSSTIASSTTASTVAETTTSVPAPTTAAPATAVSSTIPATTEAVPATLAPLHPAPAQESTSTTVANTATPATPAAVATTLAPAGRQHCPVGGDDVIRLGDGVGFGCDSVRQVQELLTSNGYPVPADGEFGPATETAVRAYQAANDLDVDGLVGPATWDILNGFAGDY